MRAKVTVSEWKKGVTLVSGQILKGVKDVHFPERYERSDGVSVDDSCTSLWSQIGGAIAFASR